MTTCPQSTRPCLRLVPREPSPRRRLGVRISAAANNSPHARTRIFRLADHDFEQLINVALQLEARR